MCADAKMMYRQILIHPDQKHVQRIVWRESPDTTLKCYGLLTVTYGTKPGSYLATRTLKELAIENREKFPEASRIIENNMYMDDLLSGSQTVSGAKQIRDQIIEIMESAKFHLRKWVSNDSQVLSDIPEADKEELNETNESIKALSLKWNPEQDKLLLNVKDYLDQSMSTKRSVLADIASFFDPLGLEGPVVLVAKLFLQKLWQLKLDWDQPISHELNQKWQNFRSELRLLKTVEFDRFVAVNDFTEIQIHGFCDASQSAYGACIYIVSKNPRSQISCVPNRKSPRSASEHFQNLSFVEQNYSPDCWKKSEMRWKLM
jgi:hypothetical protein